MVKLGNQYIRDVQGEAINMSCELEADWIKRVNVRAVQSQMASSEAKILATPSGQALRVIQPRSTSLGRHGDLMICA